MNTPKLPSNVPERAAETHERIDHFLRLASRGRKPRQHSGGTRRCIKWAEWLWTHAPGIAGTGAAAIEVSGELVQLAHNHPHHLRQFLKTCGIVDSQGKEAK